MARVALQMISVVGLVVILSGCSPSANPSGESTSDPGSPNGDRATSTSAASEAGTPTDGPEPPAVQSLPGDWSRVAFGEHELPRRAPADAAGLASVLDDPTPATLVFHPVERLTDPPGWAGERILFLGVDRRWRQLDMSRLGLADATWPGPDTYGAGRLSPDGRTWAAHTDAGVVFVNVATGAVRHVDLPGGRSMVPYVAWVPGRHVVSAYARGPRSTRYETFHVGPAGRIRPVPYDGSRTRFDTDGTPVETARSSRRELTVTRWEEGGGRSVTWELPTDFRRGSLWGVFGESGVAVYQPPRGTWWDSAMIWVFDKSSGEPQARLSVPGATSIEGWLDDGSLLLLVDNRRLISWDPGANRVLRLMELPGPFPAAGEWAAASLSLSLGR